MLPLRAAAGWHWRRLCGRTFSGVYTAEAEGARVHWQTPVALRLPKWPERASNLFIISALPSRGTSEVAMPIRYWTRP